MIVREFYKMRSDGIALYRTYSNENKKICQEETDAVYDEAIDIEGAQFTYTETEELIEQLEDEQEQ